MTDFRKAPFFIGILCIVVAVLLYRRKRLERRELTYPERFKKRRFFLEMLYVLYLIIAAVFFLSLSASCFKPVSIWFLNHGSPILCIVSTTFAALMIITKKEWEYESKSDEEDSYERYMKRKYKRSYWTTLIACVIMAIILFFNPF